MPLYEYRCDACGHRFEAIQKFSDPPLDRCPSCGGVVHKLQSAPAFQFKGSGWYVTDYAKKGEAGKAGESGEAGPAAAEKKDGGSPGSGMAGGTSTPAPSAPTTAAAPAAGAAKDS